MLFSFFITKVHETLVLIKYLSRGRENKCITKQIVSSLLYMSQAPYVLFSYVYNFFSEKKNIYTLAKVKSETVREILGLCRQCPDLDKVRSLKP